MKDFDKIIWRNALTFVEFFATWCKPCREVQTAVDRFRKQMNGRADVYRVDIEDPDVAEIVRRYAIEEVPTLMFFRRGEVLWSGSGRVDYEQLAQVLDDIEQREHLMA